MLSFLRSLDLTGAAALIAAVSATATFLAARFASAFVWNVAFGAPFVTAYAILWGPAWLRPSELEDWQMLFLLPLYLAGAIGSLVAVQIYGVLGKTFKELSPDDANR
jgi:hypothetical protein